ncbi:hypothetical protein BN1723_011895, partial [Verticillium longisporum]
MRMYSTSDLMELRALFVSVKNMIRHYIYPNLEQNMVETEDSTPLEQMIERSICERIVDTYAKLDPGELMFYFDNLYSYPRKRLVNDVNLRGTAVSAIIAIERQTFFIPVIPSLKRLRLLSLRLHVSPPPRGDLSLNGRKRSALLDLRRNGERPILGGDLPIRGGDLPGLGGDRPGLGGDLPSLGGVLPGLMGDLTGRGGDLPGLGGERPILGSGERPGRPGDRPGT